MNIPSLTFNWMKFIIRSIILLILLAHGSALMAGTPAGLAIFPVYTGNGAGDSILKTVSDRISDACAASGRFIPAEYNSLQSAYSSADGKDREEFYRNAAVMLQAEAYVLINLYKDGSGLRAVVEFIPIAPYLEGKGFKYSVYAEVPENIPLKAGRLFAIELRRFPLYARVLEMKENKTFIISAGQWHGLDTGRYGTSAGTVEVMELSRYNAVCRGISPVAGEVLNFNKYPDNDAYTDMLEEMILENTITRYGTDTLLDKRKGGAQELIIATCLVNQGASFCVPGYGSFLSMNYLGIENPDPNWTVVGLTMLLTAGHLALPSAVTGFEINFFPWIRDSDKTRGMERLQWFLWCTIPLTFTVSYYSQLSEQYGAKGLLPPVFAHHDTTAVILSALIPGGGLFYKGYTSTGWAFYSGEMALAGCSVYLCGSRTGRYCLAGLAMLKAADILAAWIFSPSYDNYRNEVSSAGGSVGFSAAFLPSGEGSGEFMMSVTKRF